MDNYGGIDLNNPFYLYALMKRQNSQHLFNNIVGYNPFFMNNMNTGYNMTGNAQYLNYPYATYDYGVKDYLLQSLGSTRRIGMNNIYSSLAAKQQHSLEAKEFGVSAIATVGQVGSLFLGGWAGIPLGLGIDYAADKYKENMKKIYAQNQKVNIITSNMLGENGLDTGLSAKQVKSISKYIRKLGVEDSMFSADDIQDMMLKFSKFGFTNDVNSEYKFKQVTKMLKDRVRDLAEFLGETNPSKLLEGLAKYRSLGFTRAQSFDIMKSMKIASDMSGINKNIIEQTIGLATSQQNPLSIDKRIVTKQMFSQLYQMNYLSRGPFSSNYLTNRQEQMAAYTSANQKSEMALHNVFGVDTNKDIYLSMIYAKRNNISLQKAFDKMQSMSPQEKNDLVMKYSKTVKDFNKIYYNKDLLATVVQENPEAGNLNIKRTQSQQLIDNIIRNLKEKGKKITTENVLFNLQQVAHLNSKELSAIKPLVQNRLTFGDWSMLDKQSEVANYKKRLTTIVNQGIKYKQDTGVINTMSRWWRGIENDVTEWWGGSSGEDIFDQVKKMEQSLKFKGGKYNKYAFFMRSNDFKYLTGAKTFQEYLQNLLKYSSNTKAKPISEEEIRKGLNKAEDYAEDSALYKVFDKSAIKYMYKKDWLKNNVSSPYEYYKNLYGIEFERDAAQRDLRGWEPLVYSKEYSLPRMLAKHKEYSKYITSKGIRGRFQVETLYDLDKAGIKGSDLDKAMEIANQYYDWQKEGAQGEFADVLKKKGIDYNKYKTLIPKLENIYKTTADKDYQKQQLLKLAMEGKMHDFKKQLKKSYALGQDDFEELKQSLSGADQAYVNAINQKELGTFEGLFTTKEDKHRVEVGKELYSAIHGAKISEDTMKYLESTIETGDKEQMVGALDLIQDKKARTKITKAMAKFIFATKDEDEDKRGEYYKYAKMETTKEARENINNMFHLMGMDYLGEKQKKDIIRKWIKSPTAALEEINKFREKHHQGFMTVRDLEKIQRMTEMPKMLGMNDRESLEFVKKVSGLNKSDKETAMVTLLHKSNDYLKDIANSTKIIAGEK